MKLLLKGIGVVILALLILKAIGGIGQVELGLLLLAVGGIFVVRRIRRTRKHNVVT